MRFCRSVDLKVRDVNPTVHRGDSARREGRKANSLLNFNSKAGIKRKTVKINSVGQKEGPNSHIFGPIPVFFITKPV